MNRKVHEIFGQDAGAESRVDYGANHAGFHLDGRRLRPDELTMARVLTQGEVMEGEVMEIERDGGAGRSGQRRPGAERRGPDHRRRGRPAGRRRRAPGRAGSCAMPNVCNRSGPWRAAWRTRSTTRSRSRAWVPHLRAPGPRPGACAGARHARGAPGGPARRPVVPQRLLTFARQQVAPATGAQPVALSLDLEAGVLQAVARRRRFFASSRAPRGRWFTRTSRRCGGSADQPGRRRRPTRARPAPRSASASTRPRVKAARPVTADRIHRLPGALSQAHRRGPGLRPWIGRRSRACSSRSLQRRRWGKGRGSGCSMVVSNCCWSGTDG